MPRLRRMDEHTVRDVKSTENAKSTYFGGEINFMTFFLMKLYLILAGLVS